MQSDTLNERLQWFERLAEEHIVTHNINDSYLSAKNISWDVLRTDLIHPICSGNKFFKLKYYLQDAIQKRHTRIATFGGAWSNHIVATAFASKFCGLDSRGYIRGEAPSKWSDTLVEAKNQGMELEFLSRDDFRKRSEYDENAPEYLIPQGGYGIPGAKGASEMLNYTDKEKYTHICCACGTGTMLAGLIQAYTEDLPGFVGIAVLQDDELPRSVEKLIQDRERASFSIHFDFHFGGYAKKNEELISFMNDFYSLHLIPTDFVYTGKLMFAIRKLVESDFFPPGSRILAIHSGGLQGNKSLKKGTLVY